MDRNVNHDTVELLQQCSAGVRMGIQAIADVEDRIQNEDMRSQLVACRQKHQRLADRTGEMLQNCGEKPADPNPVARGMAWLKSNAKMAADMSDATVADVLTDGCDMGVKSLSKYLNQYGGASSNARALAEELIALEEETAQKLRQYL